MRYRARVYFDKFVSEQDIRRLLDTEFDMDEVYIEMISEDRLGVRYALLSISEDVPLGLIETLENNRVKVISAVKENEMKNKESIVELAEDMTIGETLFKAGTKIRVRESHLDSIEDDFIYEVASALREGGPDYAAEEISELLSSLIAELHPDVGMLPFMNALSQRIDRLTNEVARNS